MRKTSAIFLLVVLAGLVAAARALHQGEVRQEALLHKIGALGARLAAGSAPKATPLPYAAWPWPWPETATIPAMWRC
jgi:hypothetical protein